MSDPLPSSPTSQFAWHFINDRLRDGRPVPKDGTWLEHTGEIVLCEQGLHASLDPCDALTYAPGSMLCLVECAGQIIYGNDKLVCSRRRIVRRLDAEHGLRYFARMRALSVIDYWDAPQVVCDYLMTGDDDIRAAAWAAAGAAARAAAKDEWRALVAEVFEVNPVVFPQGACMTEKQPLPSSPTAMIARATTPTCESTSRSRGAPFGKPEEPK